LEGAGISMQQVTGKLLSDGVQLFSDSMERIIATVGGQVQGPGARAGT
jgi:hypothetical protein